MRSITRRMFLSAASLCALSSVACTIVRSGDDHGTDSGDSRLFTKDDTPNPLEPWLLPDVDDYPRLVLSNSSNMFSTDYFNVPEDLVADYVDEFKSFAAENGFEISESSSESSYSLSATWQVVDNEGKTDNRQFRLTYQTNKVLSLTISRNSW